MTLAAGSKLGAYEILAPLGAGGMGEVYRARDPRLAREVAIKVLPEEFFDDEERRQRFEREARTLAALNHPGIAAIYSFEEIPGSSSLSSSSPSSSRHILVMELVEGEDLAQRLTSGPLPLDESLSHAKQIAEALEAAHEKGVVHRDLKPANIKVTPAGQVKLLDFGLAKILEGDGGPGSAPGVTHSPTLTARATAAGVILGTAAYMSPEQARGKPLDKRADVWAFGCVLFEMLTGKRAFEGETVSDTLAAVLLKEPDWGALPDQTPGKIRDLLRRCLRREARQRLHDIADARLDIEESSAGPTSSFSGQLPFEEKAPAPGPTVASAERASRERGSRKYLLLSWAIAAAFAAAAGALALRARAPKQTTSVLEFELHAPAGATFGNSMALSPDGRRLAFIAADEKDVERLCVRSFDSVAARPLTGTEGARFPFWSPDGSAIAFFMGDRLVRVSAVGGPVQTICTAADGRGGAWSPGDTIVFAPGIRLPLHKVSASGGIPAPVTAFGPKDYTHRWPSFLPDGRHFVYLCLSDDTSRSGVRAASLDSREDAFLVSSPGRADYDAGRLLYVRDRSLFSQTFDASRRALSGEPALVADGIFAEGEWGWTGYAAFSASGDGTLVYRRRANARQRLTWFDRSGKNLGAIGDPAVLAEPFWFPGAQRIGIVVADRRTYLQDLWQVDLARGTWTRLTFGPKENTSGLFSPDGAWLYFRSTNEGRMGLNRRPLDGSGGDELLTPPGTDYFTDFVTPDGTSLVYESPNSSGRTELWRLPLAGDRKPVLLLAMPQASVAHSSISPNGRFFAYTSDETGRAEIYVQRFPPSGGKWQISTEGGDQALWRSDGRELYFVSPDRNLHAVDLTLQDDARIGSPKPLFKTRISPNGISDNRSQYIPAPDGKRFLVLANADDRQDQPAVVVLNWTTAGAAGR